MAQAQVCAKNRDICADRVALLYDIEQEIGRIGVNSESLNLEGNLDNEVDDREDEVGGRESRKDNPAPLCKQK
jgi:hypothetical protein